MALLYYSMYHHSCCFFICLHYYRLHECVAAFECSGLPSCGRSPKLSHGGASHLVGLDWYNDKFPHFICISSFFLPTTYLVAMNNGIATEPSSQAFRSGPQSDVVYINTQHDLTTGQYVIRWKEIQRVFERAKYLKDGAEIIPFMTGDDLEEYGPRHCLYCRRCYVFLLPHCEYSR